MMKLQDIVEWSKRGVLFWLVLCLVWLGFNLLLLPARYYLTYQTSSEEWKNFGNSSKVFVSESVLKNVSGWVQYCYDDWKREGALCLDGEIKNGDYFVYSTGNQTCGPRLIGYVTLNCSGSFGQIHSHPKGIMLQLDEFSVFGVKMALPLLVTGNLAPSRGANVSDETAWNEQDLSLGGVVGWTDMCKFWFNPDGCIDEKWNDYVFQFYTNDSDGVYRGKFWECLDCS